MTDQEIAQAWEDICSRIRSYPYISSNSFDAFAAKLQPRAMSSSFLMLTADNLWVKDWVEKNYKDIFVSALKDLYGTEFEVDIELDTLKPAPPEPAQPTYTPQQTQAIENEVLIGKEVFPTQTAEDNQTISQNTAEHSSSHADNLIQNERFGQPRIREGSRKLP